MMVDSKSFIRALEIVFKLGIRDTRTGVSWSRNERAVDPC